MLRAATSTLARRTVQRSNAGVMAPRMSAAFHSSARREEEAKEGEMANSSQVAESEGFMGTGFSHLWAIPAGVCFAVPMLEFEWLVVNEETLLASTFLAFCVVAYTQGGDMISKSFKDEATSMLKLQNDAEDQVITKLEENLDYMKLTENIVTDYQAAYDLTKESYDKLNAAGLVKPQHDLKAQMEKMLTMIAQEEQSAHDKAKAAMMMEATDAVMASFGTNKDLKKAALDNALAQISGTKSAAGDPVQGAFVQYFADKAAAAKKADDGSEEKAAREAMLTKMNAVAENEGMFFRFDVATGQPKMVQ